MAIYCKTCEESTMMRTGYDDGICDKCWEKKHKCEKENCNNITEDKNAYCRKCVYKMTNK